MHCVAEASSQQGRFKTSGWRGILSQADGSLLQDDACSDELQTRASIDQVTDVARSDDSKAGAAKAEDGSRQERVREERDEVETGETA